MGRDRSRTRWPTGFRSRQVRALAIRSLRILRPHGDHVAGGVELTGESVVVRPGPESHLEQEGDGAPVASAYALCRQDPTLVRAAVEAGGRRRITNRWSTPWWPTCRRDLHTKIDGADPRAVEVWSGSGFEPHRRKIEFLFSTGSGPDPAGERHGSRTVWPCNRPMSRDEVTLRELDDGLREMASPARRAGSTSPSNSTSVHVQRECVRSRAYLVAIDDQRRHVAGLVPGSGRSTTDPGSASWGWPGRTPRPGLGRARLASALRADPPFFCCRSVMAEVDASDAAGLAIIRGIGAVETGSLVVLLRRGSPTSEAPVKRRWRTTY